MSGLFDLADPRGLRRSFVLATACSAVIWASYAFWLGRRGGQAFEDKPWVGFVLAFGVAIGVSALIEVSRRLYARYQAQHQGPGAPAGAGPDPEMAACEVAAEDQRRPGHHDRGRDHRRGGCGPGGGRSLRVRGRAPAPSGAPAGQPGALAAHSAAGPQQAVAGRGRARGGRIRPAGAGAGVRPALPLSLRSSPPTCCSRCPRPHSGNEDPCAAVNGPDAASWARELACSSPAARRRRGGRPPPRPSGWRRSALSA